MDSYSFLDSSLRSSVFTSFSSSIYSWYFYSGAFCSITLGSLMICFFIGAFKEEAGFVLRVVRLMGFISWSKFFGIITFYLVVKFLAKLKK